jgi:hypothetical protein
VAVVRGGGGVGWRGAVMAAEGGGRTQKGAERCQDFGSTFALRRVNHKC